MRLGKEIGQVIRLNLKNMLKFELFFRFFTLPFYLQVIDQGLKLALKASGYSYVTAGNLAGFLMKPATMLLLFAAGALGLFFVAVEVGGILTAYQGTVYLRKVPPYEMFAEGLKKVLDEWGKRNWKLFFLLACEFILANLLLFYRVLSHVKPVNFVMEELFHTPFGLPCLALLAAALLAVTLPGGFVLFFSMAEQKSFADSWWHSRRLMRKTGKSVLFSLIAGNLILLGCAGAGYLLAVGVSAVAITLFVKKGLQLAVLIGMRDRIELVLLLLYSVLVNILNLGIVSAVYYHAKEQALERTLQNSCGKFFYRQDKQKLLWLGTAVTVLGGFFIFDFAYNGSAYGDDALLKIQITAHRGSSKAAPENTLAAVKAAVEELADFVEIDVQESLDGILVVCHDQNLRRLAGVNRRVKDMTWEELSGLDMGSHFSEEFAGEPLPALRTVMEYAKGRVNLNIELKNIGDASMLPEKAAAMIQELGMEEQCVVSSVKLNYLERVKQAAPDIRTGYIIAAAYGNYYGNEALDFISIRSSFVTREMVEKAHESGKAVHAWTVNGQVELEKMKQAGVDNIITDYPVLAREICFREEATENLLERLRMVIP